MFKHTPTLVVLLTLLVGTSLMASASEWTVIGDGYAPAARTGDADAARSAPEVTPWAAVQDGYVWHHRRPAAEGPAQVAHSDCGHPDCSLDTCDTARVQRWSVVGDGYGPVHPGGPALEMTCC